VIPPAAAKTFDELTLGRKLGPRREGAFTHPLVHQRAQRLLHCHHAVILAGLEPIRTNLARSIAIDTCGNAAYRRIWSYWSALVEASTVSDAVG